MSLTLQLSPGPRKGPLQPTVRPSQTLRECVERRKAATVAHLAESAGICERNARRILDGEKAFTVERLDFLPASVLSDFATRLGAQLEVRTVRSPEAEAMDIPGALGDVTRALQVALADGRIEHGEAMAILEAITTLQAQANELAVAVRKVAGL